MSNEGIDIPALAQALGCSPADPRLLGDLRDVPQYMEAEIERRGLWAGYTEALIKCVDVPHPTWEPWAVEDVWHLIRRATPEQRARAFLEVVRAT